MEKTATKHNELRNGNNKIGRLSKSTPKDVNIAINTKDTYMSRHHCDLIVRWSQNKNVYEYILSDRKSVNGIFINEERRLSRSEEVFLNDGDNIQLGRTKLILKTPTAVRDSEEAERYVQESDYFKTIIE